MTLGNSTAGAPNLIQRERKLVLMLKAVGGPPGSGESSRSSLLGFFHGRLDSERFKPLIKAHELPSCGSTRSSPPQLRRPMLSEKSPLSGQYSRAMPCSILRCKTVQVSASAASSWMLRSLSPSDIQDSNNLLLLSTAYNMALASRLWPVMPGRSQSAVEETCSRPISSTLDMLTWRALR